MGDVTRTLTYLSGLAGSIPHICDFKNLKQLRFLVVSPGNCGTTFVCCLIQQCINSQLFPQTVLELDTLPKFNHVLHCHGDSNLMDNGVKDTNVTKLVDTTVYYGNKPIIITIYRRDEDRYNSHKNHIGHLPKYKDYSEDDIRSMFLRNDAYFKQMAYLYDTDKLQDFIQRETYQFYDMGKHFVLLIKFEHINNIVEIINEFTDKHAYNLDAKTIDVHKIYRNKHSKG